MPTNDASSPHRRPTRTVLRKIGQTTPVPELKASPRSFEPTPLPAPLPPPPPPARVAAPATQSSPPPAQNYPSVPPVVATVITPLSTVLEPPRARASSSLWKGVVGGTVLGLAIVGAVVVGARMTQPATSHSTAGSPPAAVPLPATAPSPARAAVPALDTVPPSTDPATPVIAATALPLAPTARWNPPVAPARPAGGQPVAKPSAIAEVPAATASASPAPGSSPVATNPSPSPGASAAAATDTPPADSAASLVPVLPPAAPPVVDPLVQAVQTDIAEEQKAKGK